MKRTKILAVVHEERANGPMETNAKDEPQMLIKADGAVSPSDCRVLSHTLVSGQPTGCGPEDARESPVLVIGAGA